MTARVETSRSRTCTQPQEVAKSPRRCLWGRVRSCWGAVCRQPPLPLALLKRSFSPESAAFQTSLCPLPPSLHTPEPPNAWMHHNLLPPRGCIRALIDVLTESGNVSLQRRRLVNDTRKNKNNWTETTKRKRKFGEKLTLLLQHPSWEDASSTRMHQRRSHFSLRKRNEANFFNSFLRKVSHSKDPHVYHKLSSHLIEASQSQANKHIVFP